MRNICLTIAYDGTAYHGFQRQPEFHGPTIQGTLAKVWKALVGEDIQIYTAGRTDTGVHAAGQVISFFSNARIPEGKIPKAFNSLLPKDIRILQARDEEEDFNARRSAQWKRYDYLIDNHPIPDVFQRLYALHEPVPLNLTAMQEASVFLEGKHNFQAFAAAGGSSKTFERILYVCRIQPDGRHLRLICVGNGFLYHMVRIIVGTLLEVGQGKLPAETLPDIIASRERKRAGETAPAHGLTLTYVNYGKEQPWDIYPDFIRRRDAL